MKTYTKTSGRSVPVHEVFHDEDGRQLGFWKVLGISSFPATSQDTVIETFGEVSDKKLAHWVFK